MKDRPNLKAALAGAAILGCLLNGSAGQCSDLIELSVRVFASQDPSAVSIENTHTFQKVSLKTKGAVGPYCATLERPSPGALATGGRLVDDYLLVAAWQDGREQFYLGLQSQLPATIDLAVFRRQARFDHAALAEIEALGADRDSLLERYTRARTYHRHWRHTKKLPHHTVAVRSAKLWFDASVNLAKQRNSPLRMDEEITEIMKDYVEDAREDADFARRYRAVVPRTGYVAGMLRDVSAARYAFVGEIPKLVQDGRLNEAHELNRKATRALKRESDEVKTIVATRQGVNLSLLAANSEYIATLRGSSIGGTSHQ